MGRLARSAEMSFCLSKPAPCPRRPSRPGRHGAAVGRLFTSARALAGHGGRLHAACPPASRPRPGQVTVWLQSGNLSFTAGPDLPPAPPRPAPDLPAGNPAWPPAPGPAPPRKPAGDIQAKWLQRPAGLICEPRCCCRRPPLRTGSRQAPAVEPRPVTTIASKFAPAYTKFLHFFLPAIHILYIYPTPDRVQ